MTVSKRLLHFWQLLAFSTLAFFQINPTSVLRTMEVHLSILATALKACCPSVCCEDVS
jgi:hypothetical protein